MLWVQVHVQMHAALEPVNEGRQLGVELADLRYLIHETDARSAGLDIVVSLDGHVPEDPAAVPAVHVHDAHGGVASVPDAQLLELDAVAPEVESGLVAELAQKIDELLYLLVSEHYPFPHLGRSGEH